MNTLRQSCPARNWTHRAGEPGRGEDPYCSDPLPVARRRREPRVGAEWMREDGKKSSKAELDGLRGGLAQLLGWGGVADKELTLLDALEKRMGFTSMGLSQLHEVLEHLLARLFDISMSDLAADTKKLCSKLTRNHMETYSSLSTLRSVLTELSADQHVQPHLEPVIGYCVASPKVTPYDGRVLSRQQSQRSGGALHRRTSFPSAFDAGGGGGGPPRRMLSENLQGVSSSYTFGTSGSTRMSDLSRGAPPPPLGATSHGSGGSLLGSSSGWKLQRQLDRTAFSQGKDHPPAPGALGRLPSRDALPNATHSTARAPPPMHDIHHPPARDAHAAAADAHENGSVESGFYADSSEGHEGCVGGWGDQSDTETVVHHQGTPGQRPGTQSSIHSVIDCRARSPGGASFESVPIYSPNSPMYSGRHGNSGSDHSQYSTDSNDEQRRVLRSRERARRPRSGKGRKQRRNGAAHRSAHQSLTATPPARPLPEALTSPRQPGGQGAASSLPPVACAEGAVGDAARRSQRQWHGEVPSEEQRCVAERPTESRGGRRHRSDRGPAQQPGQEVDLTREGSTNRGRRDDSASRDDVPQFETIETNLSALFSEDNAGEKEPQQAPQEGRRGGRRRDRKANDEGRQASRSNGGRNRKKQQPQRQPPQPPTPQVSVTVQQAPPPPPQQPVGDASGHLSAPAPDFFNETGSSIHTLISAAPDEEEEEEGLSPAAAQVASHGQEQAIEPIRSESPMMPQQDPEPPPVEAPAPERPSSSWVRGGVEIRCLTDPSLQALSSAAPPQRAAHATPTPLSSTSQQPPKSDYSTDVVSPPSTLTTPVKEEYWRQQQPTAAAERDGSPSLSSFSTSVASWGGGEGLPRTASFEQSVDDTVRTEAPPAARPRDPHIAPGGLSRSGSNASHGSRSCASSGGSGAATVPASTPVYVERGRAKEKALCDAPVPNVSGSSAAQRPPVADNRRPPAEPSALGDQIMTPRTTIRSKRHSTRTSPAQGRPNSDTHHENVSSSLQEASEHLSSSIAEQQQQQHGKDTPKDTDDMLSVDVRKSWEHGDSVLPQGTLRVRSISPSKRYRSPARQGDPDESCASPSGSQQEATDDRLGRGAPVHQGSLRRRSTSPRDRRRKSGSSGSLLDCVGHCPSTPAGPLGPLYTRTASDSSSVSKQPSSRLPTRPPSNVGSESASSRDASPHPQQRARRARSPEGPDPVESQASVVQQALQEQIDAVKPPPTKQQLPAPKQYSPRPPPEATDGRPPSTPERTAQGAKEPSTPPGGQHPSQHKTHRPPKTSSSKRLKSRSRENM